MWSRCCSWAGLLLWLWQLQADTSSEMYNFAIIVTQWQAPFSPPFSACLRAVTCVTFSLLFVTAGLSLSCSIMVELEGISHHHLIFTPLNVIPYPQPAGDTEVPSYSLNNSAIKLSVPMCCKCAGLLFLAVSGNCPADTGRGKSTVVRKWVQEEKSVGDSGNVQAACREGCCWNERGCRRPENTNGFKTHSGCWWNPQIEIIRRGGFLGSLKAACPSR